MNLTRYGISDVDSLLKTIILTRLNTGETIISYGYQHTNGVVLFLPMELYRQEDDTFSMRPFLPFVKEKVFYFSIDDVQIVKTNLIQYVRDSYTKITETLYKDDINDVLFSDESTRIVEAEIELSSGVAVH